MELLFALAIVWALLAVQCFCAPLETFQKVNVIENQYEDHQNDQILASVSVFLHSLS